MFSARKAHKLENDLVGVHPRKTVVIDVYGSPEAGEKVKPVNVLVRNGSGWSNITFVSSNDKPPRAQALDKIAEVFGIEARDTFLKVVGIGPDKHQYTYQLLPDQMAKLMARDAQEFSFSPR